MQAFTGDMAQLTQQARLRGLSPNHVLVLVNGKRRHTTSNIAVDGGLFQGGAGVDLNFIPVDAIDHIEVLTDGAAAQYGTDAIAGVINIILKKNSSSGSINGTYGNYMNGGGNTNDVSGNIGLDPTQGGYLSITGEVHGHGHSDQTPIDERLINPAIVGTYPDSNVVALSGYPYLNSTFGDAEYHAKLAMINAGVQLDGGLEIYGFGSFGDKKGENTQNFRLPSSASITDPTTGISTYPFPLGYVPFEASKETDYSLTGGIKGVLSSWNWDVSTTYGGDKFNEYTDNSFNSGYSAETGAISPTDFFDGSLRTTQWATTVDFNRDFNVGAAGPLNMAIGAEYRRETYEIQAGTPLSYLYGGPQSFSGFSPSDAGIRSRKNVAGYLELALKPIDRLRVDIAARYEHYSDFGGAKWVSSLRAMISVRNLHYAAR